LRVPYAVAITKKLGNFDDQESAETIRQQDCAGIGYGALEASIHNAQIHKLIPDTSPESDAPTKSGCRDICGMIAKMFAIFGGKQREDSRNYPHRVGTYESVDQ
jgi:hypothetical protein